jgi:flagellar biosynthesis activator protein FlaF
MSLQAYQRTATQAEDPRQLEYRLFGQVTRALMEASQSDPLDLRTRIDALDWNRRLWTVLASDCGREGNQLPEATRAGIITLSLWVQKHSSAVMRREEDFGPLIEINRLIMQGLSGQAE